MSKRRTAGIVEFLTVSVTWVLKIGGFVIAFNEAVVTGRRDPFVLSICTIAIAGPASVESFVLLLLDRFMPKTLGDDKPAGSPPTQ